MPEITATYFQNSGEPPKPRGMITRLLVEIHRATLQPRVERLQKELNSEMLWKCAQWRFPKKALEIGSGTGEYLDYCGKEGIIGLDCFEPAVKQKRKEGFKMVLFDLECGKPLPFKDETFDFVYCAHTLEHLKSPINTIREMHRILKPEGRVVIRVPDFIRLIFPFYEDYTHYTPFRKRSARRMMQDNGFEIIECGYGNDLGAIPYVSTALMLMTAAMPEKLQKPVRRALAGHLSYEIVVIAKKVV